MKNLVKHASTMAANNPAFAGFVSLLEQLGERRPNLLRVLTYHRVDWPTSQPHLHAGLISATPDAFKEQMAYVAERCHVLSARELLDFVRGDGPLPPRSVLITFDDAYVDFAEHAWPVLKCYQLPVTLFVPTAYPDHPGQAFWWDRLYQAVYCSNGYDEINTDAGRFSLVTAADKKLALAEMVRHVKSLPHDVAMQWVDEICQQLGIGSPPHHVLTWAELRELAEDGVTLAPHTRTHPLVNRIPLEQAKAESIGSLRDLEREIGAVLPIFAYPSGGYDEEVVALLRRQGFELAFTTRRGVNDMNNADPLQLYRTNIGGRTNLSLLRAQLLPSMIYLNRWFSLLDI